MNVETEPYSEAELRYAQECLERTDLPGLNLSVEQTAHLIRITKRIRAEHSQSDPR